MWNKTKNQNSKMKLHKALFLIIILGSNNAFAQLNEKYLDNIHQAIITIEPEVEKYEVSKDELATYNAKKNFKVKDDVIYANGPFAIKPPLSATYGASATRLLCMTSISFEINLKNVNLAELDFVKLSKKNSKGKIVLQRGENIFSFDSNKAYFVKDTWNSIEVFFGPKHTLLIINDSLGFVEEFSVSGFKTSERVFGNKGYLGVFSSDQEYAIRRLEYRTYSTNSDFLKAASMNKDYAHERLFLVNQTFYHRFNLKELSKYVNKLDSLSNFDPWSRFWLTFFNNYSKNKSEFDFSSTNIITTDDDWKLAFLLMSHGFFAGNTEAEFIMYQMFDIFDPKTIVGQSLLSRGTETYKKGWGFLRWYEALRSRREKQVACSYFKDDGICPELINIKKTFVRLRDKLPNDIISQSMNRTGRYDFWGDLKSALREEDEKKDFVINYVEGISRLANHQFIPEEIAEYERKFEKLLELGVVQNSIISALFVIYCAEEKYSEAETLIDQYGIEIIVSNERNPFGPKYDVSPGNIAQLYMILGKREKAVNYLRSYTESIPKESRRVWLELYEVFWTIAEINNESGLNKEVREACLDGYQNRKIYSKQACIWCLERNDPAVIDYYANLYYEKKQQSLSMKWDYYNIVNENKNIGLDGDEVYYNNSRIRYQWNKVNQFDSKTIKTKEKRYEYDSETGKYTPDGYNYDTYTKKITTKRSETFEPDVVPIKELIKFQFPGIVYN